MMKKIKILVLLIAAVLFNVEAFATEETYSVRKNYTEIEEEFNFEIIDGRYSELGLGNFYDKSSELIVKFGIEEREDFGFIGGFASIHAAIYIEKLGPTGLVESSVLKVMEISYSPNESVGGLIDLSAIKESGGHRYRITVESLSFDGVTEVPENVYLEAELSIDRYYELDMTAPALGAHLVGYDNANNQCKEENIAAHATTAGLLLCGYAPQEIEIYWSYVKGAEEYELEWTWIDNYDQESAALEFNERDFELNNTRILTRAQSYRIPLIYAEGYLIYRVRAVGRWIDNDLLDVDKRLYGDWTTMGSGVDAEGAVVDNWPRHLKIDLDHEKLKNWQYQAVYAEEGKKKEIISYFDGSLRNRQTVTRINSNKEAIVGENIYDNQGRSAIQILPTPVGNSALRYYPGLNRNGDNENFTHYDFDFDSEVDYCLSAAEPMSTISGASRYYSQTETGLDVPDVENNWQDYVPDAEGYPYVQVEYTPDNTGRVRRQSGVGADYKINGDHATQYFYLQPFQEELNRLFGYNVGYKSRYKKNLVIDANSQVSVSYIDPQGRVVATALAGVNSDGEGGFSTNLKSLDEHDDPDVHNLMTVDLLNKIEELDVDTELDDNERFITGAHGGAVDALRLSSQYGNTDSQPHIFEYSVTTDVFSDECMALGTAYPFGYRLKIDLKDDCGNTRFSAPIYQNIQGSSNPDYTDASGVTVTLGPDVLTTEILEAGSYSLSKIIEVDPDILDLHLQHYLTNLNPECLPDFFEDTRDCDDPDSDLLPDDLVINTYSLSTCFIGLETMKADLKPGGQYANTDVEDLTSIYNLENVLAHGENDPEWNWQHPYPLPGSPLDYLEEDGETVSVIDVSFDGTDYSPEITDDGIDFILAEYGDPEEGEVYNVHPEHLMHAADFASEWKDSWIDAILPYHPEYNYVRYYDDLCNLTSPSASILIDGVLTAISSETYNNVLYSIDNFDDANSTDNPLGLNFISGAISGTHTIKNFDPYFNIDYPQISLCVDPGLDANLFKSELMDEILVDYKDALDYSDVTLWEVAVKTVVCGGDMAGTCSYPTSLAELSDEQKNNVWNTYKTLYISEKKKIDQFFVDLYGIRFGFYNGYIGEETPSVPNLTGFLYYESFFVADPGEIGIVSLYNDAIEDVDNGDYPWFENEHVSEFSEKVRRFEHIHSFYETSIPEDEMVDIMTEEVDADIYTATGKCAYLLDVEMLLGELTANSHLAPSSLVNSNDLDGFTPDLYAEMGGGAGDGTHEIEMSSSLIAGGIEIKCTNAETGSDLDMKSIIINDPSVGAWTDIIALDMMYYIPTSFDGTYYYFQILASMDIAGDYQEVILTGKTKIKIGNCEEDYPVSGCGDVQRGFAHDLMAVFAATYNYTSGTLDDLTTTNAYSYLGGWYLGSQLSEQLLEVPSSPLTQLGVNAAEKEILISHFEISRAIQVLFYDIPSDISIVTGADYDVDDAGYELTIYYINNSGDFQSLQANVREFCASAPSCDFLELDCPEPCIPSTLAPKSCTDQWGIYNLEITELNDNLYDLVDFDGEEFPTYVKEQFCDTRLAYAVDAYLQYIGSEGFNITSPEQEHYLSISEFSSCSLNNFYEDEDGNLIYDAIEDYVSYIDATLPGETYLNWYNYINEVYLVERDICPPNQLNYYPNYSFEYPCEMYIANIDIVNAKNQKEIYLAELAENFKTRYLEEAISSLVENFSATYDDKEYHYTLYYYDQAGNLIQTVPPKGIDRLETGMINNDLINENRMDLDTDLSPEEIESIIPEHSFKTQYKYNSLNQLVWQTTPDGGESNFAYDELGRLVVSQNAKQKAYTVGNPGREQFSYTRYDELGRIIEVGEVTTSNLYSFNEDGKFVNGTTLIDVSADNFPNNLTPSFLEEVTITKYDELSGIASSEFENYAEYNTRNRITGVYYFESFAGEPLADYDNATFYDYDVHGNVKELIQANKDLLEEGFADQQFKKIKYTYDLVSGNVKEVVYQDDQADQFIHEYEYDADNRITNVRTSEDEIIWEQDAKYFYYDHGPLARKEIGDKKVQASDFAYTIQGWLKGVNSEDLVASNDQGKDAATGLNKMSGKDVFGYSLQYYENDYSGRYGNDFLTFSDEALLPNLNLYNGNIREMYTASTNTNEEYIGTSHTSYEYDQLNRIKRMTQENLSIGSLVTHGELGGNYESDYTYDSNGNLLSLNRWAENASGLKQKIDEFTYNYEDPLNNNKLESVYDALGVQLDDDLGDQEDYEGIDIGIYSGEHNYAYDEIGQLIQDKQEEILKIEWKVTGKVHKIIRKPGSLKNNLEFVYDAMGNRIMKIMTNNDGDLLSKTYYIRDAQGNVMSIYRYDEERAEQLSNRLMLSERSIYGSSRVGTENPNYLIAIAGSSLDHTKLVYNQTVGDKRYELANHLGNVLEVVTDRKLAIQLPDSEPGDEPLEGGVVDYYVADVVSQSDYYPFGMLMPNRVDEGTNDYRYSFQGQEKDNEIKGDNNSVNYKYRMHDPRIGRFFAVDPLAASYPHNGPYNFSENRVIDRIELEGLEVTYVKTPGNDGKTIITVTSKVQILDQTSKGIDLYNLISQTEKQMAASYSGMVDENTEIIFVAEIEEVTEITSDYSVVVVDEIPIFDDQGNIVQYAAGVTKGGIGKTNANQIELAYTVGDDQQRTIEGMVRSLCHEFGHSMGLWHPDIEDNFGDPSTSSPEDAAKYEAVVSGADFGQLSTQVKPEDSPENLIRQSHRTSGTEIEPEQRSEILIALKGNEGERKGANTAGNTAKKVTQN